MPRPTVVPTSPQSIAFLQAGEMLAKTAAFQSMTGTASIAAAWAFINYRDKELRGDPTYNPANGRKHARIFESGITETPIGGMANGAFEIILNLTVPDTYLDATEGGRHIKYDQTENAYAYWENIADGIRQQMQETKNAEITVGAVTYRMNFHVSRRPADTTGTRDSEKLQEGEKPFFQAVIVLTWW